MSQSKIYKELTQSELEKIITDLYGNQTKLVSANILKGGLFNTTYKVNTDQEENGFVLRVGPVNKHLLMDFEKDMMAAEPHFHQLLQEHDIPTSKIIKYSPENTILERDYIAVEYMESIPMNDPSVENINLDSVYETVGKLTSKLHKIANDKFGWWRKTDWGLFDKWSLFIKVFSKELADKVELHNLLPTNEVQLFREIISANSNVLDEITTPHMIHTDLWQGNVLLSNKNGDYEVAGIIDLDRTIFGDCFWDFSTPWLTNESFFKGYEKKFMKTESYQKRELIYKMLLALMNTYVVLIEYDNTEWYESEVKNASELILTNSDFLLK
ncbi:phosphotransferase [Paludicola sp. MB14-C6]|uniref:phosphotransferase family protein n=1 Tax=Paludihabitans sp. MB14-C6 TaxID=3070656 RepID=UPI0027DCC48E|nr:phosphotransferase [Paludicola sp. MB14-C6]WMJ23901.1 phosphotransferase [Paludicola sp. MB14-C6]